MKAYHHPYFPALTASLFARAAIASSQQRKIKKALLSLVSAALVGYPLYAQNLLRNGSFEQPPVVSNTFQNITPTSWTWGGNAGVVVNGTIGASWPLPSDGHQYADIGNALVGSFALSQTFTSTNQGVYFLRWFDSTGGGSSPYSIAVTTGAGQTVATTNFNAFHADTWRPRVMRFTLGPGTYSLRFSSGGGIYDTLLDNVSLEQDTNADLLATIACSAVDVCWNGRTNQIYQVQYRTELDTNGWFDLGVPVVGTGANCVADSIRGSQRRFYRIVRAP